VITDSAARRENITRRAASCMMADVMDRSAREVAAGKYATADAASAGIQRRLGKSAHVQPPGDDAGEHCAFAVFTVTTLDPDQRRSGRSGAEMKLLRRVAGSVVVAAAWLPVGLKSGIRSFASARTGGPFRTLIDRPQRMNSCLR
jgi:hypothetical protein